MKVRPLFLNNRLNRFFWIGLVLTAFSSRGQVVPSSRLFQNAWRNAGNREAVQTQNRYVDVKDFGAVADGEANDHAAVIAAIASLAGEPGVVFFPAGIYWFGAGAIHVPAGTVLRGQSARSTILRFQTVHNTILIRGVPSGINPPGAWISLTASAAMHDQTVTVAEPGGFSVGDYAAMRQEDDPDWGITDGWARKSAGQMVRIVAVDGDRLTLESPLRHDYPLSRSPEIWQVDLNRHSGVENMRIERLIAGAANQRNNMFTIHFQWAADGWVRGVHLVDAFGSHISLEHSTRIEISGCYFDNAHEYGGGGRAYGVTAHFRSGENLVQDNIFRWLRHSILVQAGANGNVFGYNYSRDTKSDSHSSWASDVSLHGNYAYANLFEGNIVEHMWIDNSHRGRNGPYNTFFRNRAEKCGFNMTDPAAHGQNVVGNELLQGDFLARRFAGNGYRFLGENHFTHGNRSVAAGLQPAGTDTLPEISYYLSGNPTEMPDIPAWWTIADPLPVIGPEHELGVAKTNPARSRFLAKGDMTVPAPVPIIDAEALDFGTEAVNRSLTVTNTGNGTLSWRFDGVTYEEGQDWITALTPAAGAVSNTAADVSVTINRLGLNPGAHTAYIRLTSNGGNISVPVTLEH